MMKPVCWLYLFLIGLLALAGCEYSDPTMQPTQITLIPSTAFISPASTPVTTSSPTITKTPRVVAPTSTLTSTSTQTVTPTPLNVLEPTQAKETILALLREPACPAPCFWGTVPGKTTYAEANNFFLHFGISPFNSTDEGKNFASYEYLLDSDTDLSIQVLLMSQDNVVENQEITMSTGFSKARTESYWMAYSPKNIIQRYGKPSRVEFYWGLGQKPTFTILLYFDEYDLIGEFGSPDGPEPSSPRECPLAVKYEHVRLWMGKNPVHPPTPGAPLEEGTSLTIDEFTKLITGNPSHSCFTLNINAFLPH